MYIHIDLNLTLPEEPQAFCLEKLTEIKAFLFDEIEVCERLAKKMKKLNKITSIIDTSLITSTVITRGIYIDVLTSSVCLPVDISLS